MSLQYGILIVYNVFTPVIATKKIAMKKNEKNQRVSDLSKKRHRNDNLPNAYGNERKND